MARRGCTYNETVYFTQGTADSIVKHYAGGGDDSYSLEIRYDGDQTIEVIKSGYGGVIARATYGATDAQVPYIAFGTRKTGVAPGLFSSSFGEGLIAKHAWQMVIGKFNAAVNKLFVLGNGTDDSNRSNALTVDWDGNVECGDITCTSANGVDPAATVPVSRGGTGQTSANAAARALGMAKTAGDTIALPGIMCPGWLSSDKKLMHVCVPLPYMLYDASSFSVSGQCKIRQYDGTYLMGTTASSWGNVANLTKAKSVGNGFINIDLGTGTAQGSAAKAYGCSTIEFSTLTITLS